MEHKKRFLILGIMTMLCFGMVYAWSVFVVPLENEFGWSREMISLAYTGNMGFYTAGSVISGYLNKNGNHRTGLLISAFLFAAGYFLMYRMENIIILYLGYSLLIGLANGIAYVSLMSSSMSVSWKRRGLINGILMMAIGMGGMIFTPVVNRIVEDYGVRSAFVFLCITVAAVISITGLTAPSGRSGNKDTTLVKERLNGKITDADVRYRRYWIWTTLFTTVGLGVISQIAACAADIKVAAAKGALMVGVFSVCNGAGRLISGRLYDVMPYRRILFFISVLFLAGSISILAAMMSGKSFLLAAGAAFIGVAYGGTMLSNATIVRIFYDEKEYSVKLGNVNITALAGSVLSFLVVSLLYRITGTYLLSFFICICISIVNLILQRNI